MYDSEKEHYWILVSPDPIHLYTSEIVQQKARASALAKLNAEERRILGLGENE